MPEKTPPENVQTVQEDEPVHAEGAPFIEFAQTTAGEWHWCYWSKNGRPMAINARPYKSRNDATQGCDAMLREMGAGHIKQVIAR